jgi:hypothetical protein
MTAQEKSYFTRKERIEILKDSLREDIMCYNKLVIRLRKCSIPDLKLIQQTIIKLNVLESRAVKILGIS